MNHNNYYVGLDQWCYSTLGPVSTWMGDHLRAGYPSWHVTSHLGQLSLAIPLWLRSNSKSWHVNRRTIRCTSPISMVLQYKMASGWGLRGNEDQCCPIGHVARKGLYFYIIPDQVIMSPVCCSVWHFNRRSLLSDVSSCCPISVVPFVMVFVCIFLLVNGHHSLCTNSMLWMLCKMLLIAAQLLFSHSSLICNSVIVLCSEV